MMGSSKEWFYRCLAVLLAVLLAMPAGQVWGQAAGPAPSASGEQDKPATQSPAGRNVVAEGALPENPAPAQQAEPAPSQPAEATGGPAAQQNGDHKPVGTAAAPYERTMGIAASRPAGAAIAPAKQRRVRTILISVGVIVGAGIAVGSVAALSHGSPSRP